MLKVVYEVYDTAVCLSVDLHVMFSVQMNTSHDSETQSRTRLFGPSVFGRDSVGLHLSVL